MLESLEFVNSLSSRLEKSGNFKKLSRSIFGPYVMDVFEGASIIYQPKPLLPWYALPRTEYITVYLTRIVEGKVRDFEIVYDMVDGKCRRVDVKMKDGPHGDWVVLKD